MSEPDTYTPAVVACGGQFPATHWSVVVLAGQESSTPAADALEKLCRAYWYPLYVFVRRRGYDAHTAQDLTQSFFARLLEKHYLNAVDRTKGKFRSFLLASMEHFLANAWRDAHAQKRGGNASFISIDDDSAEGPYLQLPASELSPEKLFEQQWALALLDQVLARLRAEFATAGKAAQFDALKGFLTGRKQEVAYAELAGKLNSTEAALKMAVSRLRHRYGEVLREEIGNTVTTSDEVEEELKALFTALSR
jgi:RNA polymerase sigma-70 factor (ECF subfamily)